MATLCELLVRNKNNKIKQHSSWSPPRSSFSRRAGAGRRRDTLLLVAAHSYPERTMQNSGGNFVAKECCQALLYHCFHVVVFASLRQSSNITITQLSEELCWLYNGRPKLSIFKLRFVLFYVYNYDIVALTLYIIWTVFCINYILNRFACRASSFSFICVVY